MYETIPVQLLYHQEVLLQVDLCFLLSEKQSTQPNHSVHYRINIELYRPFSRTYCFLNETEPKSKLPVSQDKSVSENDVPYIKKKGKLDL